jgi:hypothetical protein
MVLKAETRQMFVDLGFEGKACSQLKNDNRDDEFLVSRVLFLTTYANADLEALVEKHGIAETIATNLERHAERQSAGKSTTDPMEEMALTETLKLLFNISHHCKDRTASFTPAIPHLVTLLCHGTSTPAKPLDTPVVSLVNALLNLDLGAEEVQTSLYPEKAPTTLADRLIDLLGRSSRVYSNEELETTVTALVGVIRRTHAHAPEDIKASIRKQLLPTEDDRNEVLGQSGTLPSWLLRTSVNPVTPQLGETISNLLYDMSDNDASKFIENVGYGYASGFLFSHDIPVPQSATEAVADGSDRPVNPVTGQFLDSERHPEVPEMTDEEKEREAERLFVLFER